eukprot:jgi/Bigna1/81413/fgenesh1_pg.80_\
MGHVSTREATSGKRFLFEMAHVKTSFMFASEPNRTPRKSIARLAAVLTGSGASAYSFGREERGRDGYEGLEQRKRGESSLGTVFTCSSIHFLPLSIITMGGSRQTFDNRSPGWPFQVGSACKALSMSPNERLMAVCGRDVFKIVSLSNDPGDLSSSSSSSFKEVQSLHQGRKQNLTFSSNDVHWHPLHANSDLLASAATNSTVVVWNLASKLHKHQQCLLQQHRRSVNRVRWHPSEPNLLLSASQVVSSHDHKLGGFLRRWLSQSVGCAHVPDPETSNRGAF